MPRKRTLSEFIERARAIHGDKYDYSKVVYTGVHDKVCIICPKHGEFWQEPNNHISRKTKARDAEKKRLCNEHGIEILYFSDIGIDFPYPVIEDSAVLINVIKERGHVDPSMWKDHELPFPD